MHRASSDHTVIERLYTFEQLLRQQSGRISTFQYLWATRSLRRSFWSRCVAFCLPSSGSILKDFNALECGTGSQEMARGGGIACDCNREPQPSSASQQLKVKKWRVSYATHPKNIYWYECPFSYMVLCLIGFFRNSAAFLSQAEPVDAELALVVSSPPPERPALHPALLPHHSVDHHLHHRQVQCHETHPLLKCAWPHNFTAAHLMPYDCAVCVKWRIQA